MLLSLGDVALESVPLGELVLGELIVSLRGDVVSALGNVVVLGDVVVSVVLGDVVVGALGCDGVVAEFGVPADVVELESLDWAYTMPPATANAAAEPTRMDFRLLMRRLLS